MSDPANRNTRVVHDGVGGGEVLYYAGLQTRLLATEGALYYMMLSGVTKEGAPDVRRVSITRAGEMRTAFWVRALSSMICFGNDVYTVTVSFPQ